MNAGKKLKNVKDETISDSASSTAVCSGGSTNVDQQPAKRFDSKLEWDLNSILSQRNKFFASNDDEDDSSSESDWNESIENN